MEVKDFFKGEPLSYSLEENLREILSPNLKIKSIKRKAHTFNVIVENAGKKYRISAVKANAVEGQWHFTSGEINTFNKKKLIEGILRASQPAESKKNIVKNILNNLIIELKQDLIAEEIAVKKDKIIFKEKKEMSGFIPTAADESYIMLLLAIGCAKRSLPNLNSLAYFDKKDEQSMIDEGIKVIEGKITAEKYAEKFLAFIRKYNKTKIEKQDESFILNQVEARIARNQSSVVNSNIKA